MGTIKRQQQIELILKKLGWSRQQLADILYEAKYMSESDDFFDVDPKEIKKFGETLKKQLLRPTTSEALLVSYLEILIQHPDYEALNLGMVLPTYIEHDVMDENTLNRLRTISNLLDDSFTVKIDADVK